VCSKFQRINQPEVLCSAAMDSWFSYFRSAVQHFLFPLGRHGGFTLDRSKQNPADGRVGVGVAAIHNAHLKFKGIL